MTAATPLSRRLSPWLALIGLAQGAVAGAGSWVAGLGSPVTLGVLTALFALIPFTTSLTSGGAGPWLLFQGETAAVIGIWLWGVAVVSQIDSVL